MKPILRSMVLMLVLAVATAGPAMASSAGQAGAYLKMGVGARALGMGSAFVAVADDGTAAFWNPAGLARLAKPEASFMHANLTLDRKYNFFSYAHPLKKDKNGAVVALSHVRFGIDGIPETRESTNQPGEPATEIDGTWVRGNNVRIFSYFDDTETSTFGSYARKFGTRWLGGANLKMLRQSLFTNKADSYGLDLGFMYQASDKAMLGLSLRDLGEELKWDTDSGHSDRVPVTTTVGVAYKPKKDLTFAADINKVENLNAKFNAGAEYWLKEFAALRLGTHEGDLTLGASFKAEGWRFDYSYVDETLGVAHRLSALKQF